MRLVILCVLVAGCGASYLPNDKDFSVSTCSERLFYLDDDSDGWGAAGDPVTACEPDTLSNYTATNPMDCDDNVSEITGEVGSGCADELIAYHGVKDYAGVVQTDTEFVVIYGESTKLRFTSAADACSRWGAPVDDGSTGRLATFSAKVERVALQDAVNPTEPFAAFIGIKWDGVSLGDGKTSLDDGDWVFVDGRDTDVLQGFPFCRSGGPTPWDFYPDLTHTPTNEGVVQAEHEALRLAMVYDGSRWCLGLPTDAGYTSNQAAHFFCVRDTPNPDDYVFYAEN